MAYAAQERLANVGHLMMEGLSGLKFLGPDGVFLRFGLQRWA
jgi:hypothetical protein